MADNVEWDIDANLPLYTRDYLRMIKEVNIQLDYPATSLNYIRDYLKEHDPEVLNNLIDKEE